MAGSDDDKGKDGGAKPEPPKKPEPPPDPLAAEVLSVPLDRLRETFPDEIEEVVHHAGQVSVLVRSARLGEVLGFLRDDEACQCDLLIDQCGADFPDREQRFEVIYHLYSIPKGHFLRLKVRAAEGEEVPTATGLWPTADWFEREIFDLFGVPFRDHPDLRRILMPDHWRGHPLRKDYPLAGHPDQHIKLR